jgi:hypothetical protein
MISNGVAKWKQKKKMGDGQRDPKKVMANDAKEGQSTMLQSTKY